MKIENCPPAGEAGRLKIAKDEGFSLIELMVVMAIIGILAATAVVNVGNNADRDVRQEKDRLTSFLREVQNKALAGDVDGLSYNGKICGYGVSANDTSDSTEVYSYYVVSGGLNDVCSNVSISKKYADNINQKIDTFSFKNGVSVSDTFEDVFFLIPNGAVYKEDGTALPSGEKINISLKKGNHILDNILSIDASGNIN